MLLNYLTYAHKIAETIQILKLSNYNQNYEENHTFVFEKCSQFTYHST